LFYPEFYIFGVVFVVSLQIAFVIGGIITILGAILYARNVSSAFILIVIGAFLGGLNIISICAAGMVRRDLKGM
jgi:hypothetical protein